MRKFIAPIAVAPLLISGCVTAPGVDVATAQERFNNSTPTCAEGKECEVKWAAARRWVLENSSMKIQHYSADFIETFNPTGYSAGIAARVTKEPVGSSGYRIAVEVWCANFLGCVPPSLQAAQSFNDYVNGSWSEPAPAQVQSTGAGQQ